MRRSFILSTVLAASVAVIGACSSTANTTTPNKPVATPAPVSTASPISSPLASPSVSPAEPGDVKKPDDKPVNKGVKPLNTATQLAK